MTLIWLIFTDFFYLRLSRPICVISVPSLWNTDDADIADFHRFFIRDHQLNLSSFFYQRPSRQICVISVPSLWNTDDADLADFH